MTIGGVVSGTMRPGKACATQSCDSIGVETSLLSSNLLISCFAGTDGIRLILGGGPSRSSLPSVDAVVSSAPRLFMPSTRESGLEVVAVACAVAAVVIAEMLRALAALN
eukprot:CAMPEP_0115829986 /NCGR_PEP_ID=MMETSP0287-20121206/1383_1 /TAXON_ID=412157 /ORGANISM="Chrysochromulina rotalis, Strain UIO044" /LENGTH=108 /DNA_ID=CAMNT_0003283273 /DNA_START=1064 /DNA_END=1390 /DNA_ORIENTATION=-